MKLHIDTSKGQSVTFILSGGPKEWSKTYHERRNTVGLLRNFLKEAKCPLSSLKEITVITGPGSFTGVRVGIVIARTLGLFLGIPVNGKKATEPIEPVYEKSKFD